MISFLKGIVSKSHCNPFLLAVIEEAIYHLKNTNLILPHCFLTNLVKTFISGLKTVTAINGKILPGASDTSYRKWVNENGRQKNGVPYCDLDVYVDNVGKYIVKKYRVHSERNNSPTVVTAVINIELQQNKADTKNIQFIENLKPRYWQGTLTEEAIQCLMGKEIENACNDFREYRYCYLRSLFQFLSSSDDMENLIVKEIYDLELPSSNRCCSHCNKVFYNRKVKCDDCGNVISKIKKADNSNESAPSLKAMPKYFEIGEINGPNHVQISMGEPILVNPNSFKNLETILDQLHENIIENSEREWLFVGADGPPYCLMRRLLKQNPGQYDWVSLVSGGGHLNMNLLKTYFKILEKIILEPLGKEILKYDTQKLFDYFIQCKDNHIAW